MMGGPCSGKSTRAEELRHHFQELGMRVNVVGEDQLAWDKGKLHTVSEERKILERAIRSSLEQTAMDAGSITILDTMLCSVAHSSVLRRNLTGMFHMYGWRSIVVFCDTPVLEAWQWCQAQAAVGDDDDSPCSPRETVSLCQDGPEDHSVGIAPDPQPRPGMPYTQDVFELLVCQRGALEIPNRYKYHWDYPTVVVQPDASLPLRLIERCSPS